MAFQRKSSKHIADAQERAANLINAEIAAAQTALDAYNVRLAKADAAGNEFKAAEKQLRALSARMLAGVGVKHGKDSNEYEMAGGTRASEINYHPTAPTEQPGGGGA